MAAKISGEKRRRIKEHFLKAYAAKCFYCSRELPLTIDHFVPLSKGGGNELKNLRPACFECNEKKRDLMPSQFRVVLLNRETLRGFRVGQHQCGNLFCCG